MIGVLTKRENKDTETQGGHVEMEADAGVMQAKDRRDVPEAGRGKEGFFLKTFGGSMVLLTPWFWTSSFGNCERVVLTTHLVALCYSARRKLMLQESHLKNLVFCSQGSGFVGASSRSRWALPPTVRNRGGALPEAPRVPRRAIPAHAQFFL